MSAVLAFAALLLLPGAAALGGHDAHGRLSMPHGVALRGEADLQGDGLLEIGHGPDGDVGLQAGFARLERGWLVERTRERVSTGLPGVTGVSVDEPDESTRSLGSAGAGRVENVRCGPACLVLVHAAPGEGLVGARGVLADAPSPAAEARDVHTSTPGQGPGSQVRHVLPAGTLVATREILRDAQPQAAGRVELVISDATFDLVTEDGRREVDARSLNETARDAAGRPVTVRQHTRHAVLVLEDPALALAPGTPFRLGFPSEARVRLDGALSSPDASGALVVDGETHALDRDAVRLEGAMTARLRATPPGVLDARHGAWTDFEGRLTRAVVAGVDVTPFLSPQAARTAGGGALAALALVALGRLAVPLYHRLGPSDVLGNANRRRIYETIRARPGVSVAEIVEAVGLSRILVRHHLGMLEAHKLVRATSWRRRRTYAVAGADAGRAACELKDATRRRIASALARGGPATQTDLVRALGLSQRLVSYHLARLEASALVRAEGRNPRSYAATEELVCALEREEGGGEEGRGKAAADARATAA
ncbi:MAG TPA: winged helix-turn-helix transcriptional regulator [Candidatus Thermoplasmatota archaeon]|nr:winged helix-turn-helix transcriptional regulator [Candidatus Thermoplasmatota archaeon]